MTDAPQAAYGHQADVDRVLAARRRTGHSNGAAMVPHILSRQ
ncbi:hypothetical protein [Streptomyces sp. NPDC056660]